VIRQPEAIFKQRLQHLPILIASDPSCGPGDNIESFGTERRRYAGQVDLTRLERHFE
jgi:hypothetical protein